jgi:uncharacterized protein (DUF1800 family)
MSDQDVADEASGNARSGRRALLAGLAGTGAAAWYVTARGFPGDSGSFDLLPPRPSERRAASRPADAGGYANRDESYARSIGPTEQISATQEPPPTLVFPTAGEAAAATAVTVPTILDTSDPVIHLLRRATFGPTPALVDEVHAVGIDAWLDAQMAPAAAGPATAAGDELDAIERALPLAGLDAAGVRAAIPPSSWDAGVQYCQATLARQIWSGRHLHEVMADFWANHLNVTIPDNVSWDVGGPYQEDVIRRHALGSFTDMLLAAMQHPAMLRYLTNVRSSRDAMNENLGRELLELHTVGVASGYSEVDVRNSAQILTGRTVADERGPGPEGTFVFDPALHWTGPVQVLDFTHPNATAEGGLEVGDLYLRHLAAHPSTARTIAYKLAVRFVADVPPPTLVDRLATAYLESATAIVPVLQTLFRSAEFWAAVGQKTRRPLDNVVASVRVLGVRPGADPALAVRSLEWWTHRTGQPPLAWPAPDGYPDVHAAWRSASGVLATWNCHKDLVQGWDDTLATVPPDELIGDRPRATVGEYVDGLCQRLCFQTFQSVHRDALIAFVGADAGTPTDQSELPGRVEHLAPLVLDSPYFTLR